jgi:hypothetical protein
MSKRKAITIQIAEKYNVTVDVEDADRVAAQTWKHITGDQNRSRFSAVIGSERSRPQEQLLSGFILGVEATVFVEQIDSGDEYNYRRSNLRIYRPRTA